MDAGDELATMEAAMAKRFATDTCYDVCNDAIQLLGGYVCSRLHLFAGEHMYASISSMFLGHSQEVGSWF